MSSAGSRHRRNNNRSGTLPVVLAVLAVVAVVAVVVMVTVGGNNPGEDVADGGSDTPNAGGVGQTVSVDTTGCLGGLESADTILAAAAPAAEHWQNYVEYESVFSRGEINTRPELLDAPREAGTEGPAAIREFKEAQRTYADPGSSCPVSNSEGQALPAGCVQRAQVADKAVTAATDVVKDFETQLSYVSAQGRGEMTPGQFATARDRLHASAPAKLSTYDAATNALESAPECPLQPVEATGTDAQ